MIGANEKAILCNRRAQRPLHERIRKAKMNSSTYKVGLILQLMRLCMKKNET